MLRPSSLLSGSGSATTPTAPKSFLRPATFQVGSTTDESAASDSASDATPPANEASSLGAASSSTPSLIANNPFLSLINKKDDENPSTANEANHKPYENGNQTTNGLPKAANLFKTANPTIPTSTTTSGFVFGQNVHERVTGESIQGSGFSSLLPADSSTTTGQLFAIAGSSAQSDTAGTPSVEASVENLNEVARVYEESRAQKRKYEEVKTFTGEENETNVMDVSSKLFTFVAGNWEERGPGNLRVNDNKDRKKNSRVVFRTLGNLRVLINTKIWSGMVVERPSQKSLRFSAIDSDGQIKIYLAMARPEDVTSLFNQLTRRINAEKIRAEAEEAAKAETASQSAIDTESESSPSSSAISSNTPTIEVTKVVDEDSGEVEEVSSPKRRALDSSTATTEPNVAAIDDGVDTTTANVD